MQSRKIKGYGWKRDTPDPRDRSFNLEEPIKTDGQLPLKVSLRDQMPPVYDQAQLGSCTANGNAAIFQHRQSRQGESEGKQVPSRLFIYYNERVAEGTDPSQDSGAEVRTGIKVLVSQGAPPETVWPYSDANPGPFAQKPPDGAYQAARRFEAVKYQRITPASWPAAPFRTALANGLPIVFGFPVPAQFEDSSWDAASTPLALPDQSTQFVGGHCTVCVGYDFSRERFSVPVFEIRNSWGSSWGDAGHFWMPFEWFNDTTLASDFWVVSAVS